MSRSGYSDDIDNWDIFKGRKSPHKYLSIRALKRRLYRVGVPNIKASEIAHEIKREAMLGLNTK